MPKLHCPCGFVHNLSPIPDDGYLVVRDKDWDSVEWPDTPGQKASADALGKLHDLAGSMYECPECGRLMWTRDNEHYQIYVRDNPPVLPE